MATGQTLLDTMELLDQELQLQAGENDVTRGLLALNRSQDFLESVLTKTPRVYGDSTTTVATVAQTETSTFPSGFLRIDRMQRLDPNTNRPVGPDLENLNFVGGHVSFDPGVPTFLTASEGEGQPRAYWTNGRSIYWAPLPDAVHTMRVYGLQAQSDISAGGTFAYPDHVILPLAAFAVRLMQLGVGDDVTLLDSLAQQIFGPTVEALRSYVKDRASGYDYQYIHTE